MLNRTQFSIVVVGGMHGILFCEVDLLDQSLSKKRCCMAGGNSSLPIVTLGITAMTATYTR